ncbi:hypothetical protein [Sphingomonas guangdongensis]|uniref:hypothetical protein n=1 Tax=Sphingomonas guangdongensis TaxID=1141890 RepID=UPI000BE48823|nr:hypothetical protein [Sphingomonas guangdongensis]
MSDVAFGTASRASWSNDSREGGAVIDTTDAVGANLIGQGSTELSARRSVPAARPLILARASA